MNDKNLKKDREAEILSGTKETVNSKKNDIIKNIEINAKKAIAHEEKPHDPKKKPGFHYDEGEKSPSSD